jgi:hypothetical protein
MIRHPCRGARLADERPRPAEQLADPVPDLEARRPGDADAYLDAERRQAHSLPTIIERGGVLRVIDRPGSPSWSTASTPGEKDGVPASGLGRR